MKFGGHETFFLRPGWLTKGLFLVRDTENVAWNSNAASDAMGVGRNMSKSIGWWLNLTGLVQRSERKAPLSLTSLGRAVLQHDPFLTHTASWWFIHVAMTLSGHDDVFSWFFRTNRDDRFTKALLEGNLVRHLEESGAQVPAVKTLHRDVSVLLQSYARSIPAPENQDPEDNLECPLRRLALLVHRSDLDDYERRATTTFRLPAAAVAAALNLDMSGQSDREQVDIPLDFTGPVRRIGRVFGRGAEEMTSAISLAGDDLGRDLLSIRHLAGQRVATARRLDIADWYDHHFVRQSSDSTSSGTKTQAA